MKVNPEKIPLSTCMKVRLKVAYFESVNLRNVRIERKSGLEATEAVL